MSFQQPSLPVQSTHGATTQAHDGPVTVHPAQPDELLRLPAVCKLTTLGKSSVYSIPDFPKPVVLSRRAVAWKKSELMRWIDSRAYSSNGGGHAKV